MLLILFSSCKSTSNIVTSKDEAKKKGIYIYQDKAENINDKDLDISRSEKQDNVESGNSLNVSFSEQITNTATSYLGVRYRTGGATRTGMDCSGLVFKTFSEYDISLPRASIDMSKEGKIIKISDAKPGDLIFFKTNGKKVINHVGIVLSNEKGQLKFIHSSTSKGVIVSSTSDPYYSKTLAQVNRVIN